MKLTSTKSLGILISGMVLAGLLAGCGNQSSNASASPSNTASSSSTSNQNSSSQHHAGQGLVKMLENAGASEVDAQNLAKLIQQSHTDPKWVVDQLKNKVSVSNIMSEINSGKATKMQWNGKGNHKQNPDTQSNSSNPSDSSSNQ